MAITLKRQISDEEKKQVISRDGRICYATGHSIPEGEPVHFDHIKAYSDGGGSFIDNIAPMCEPHNKAKGRLPLEDFRINLRLKEFFKKGDRLTLGDLLEHLKEKGDIKEFALPVSVKSDDNRVTIESPNRKDTYNLYHCPTTKWKYFYATLPIEILASDDDSDHSTGLQPRYLIFDKVFGLFRHFQAHPVLQPSLGRIVDNRIKLFDGQHKAAALLWGDRHDFECKIYIECDARLLNKTNISAHDKFAQTRFFSSIMVIKLGDQFGKEFEEYKNSEDDEHKSEAGFMRFLMQNSKGLITKGEVNKQFRSYLYNSVLDATTNKCCELLSASNRSSDAKPLTIDMLSKSLLGYLYLHPVEDDMTTDKYLREAEVNNVIFLMNVIYDRALSSWNAEAGQNDSNQRKLNRMFRSKSIMSWSEIMRDAICGKLDLMDRDKREMPFYRELSDSEKDKVKSVVERLVDWKEWSAPANSEIDRILSDNKKAVKDWLRNKGLTTGYLMGAPE